MLIQTQSQTGLINMVHIVAIYFDHPDDKTARLIAKTIDGTEWEIGLYNSDSQAAYAINHMLQSYNSRERSCQLSLESNKSKVVFRR